MAEVGHIPVLLEPVLRLLDPQPGETAVDLTIGRGGHAVALAERIGESGRLYGCDLDEENVRYVRDRLARDVGEVASTLIHGSFAAMPRWLEEHGVRADVVLADLGFSSSQVDDPARGFSFLREGPLDMRLDRSRPTSAADLVATLPEPELADLIYRNGEERLSRRIARKLVEAREIGPIETTTTLARLVREAYGPQARRSRIDPATRTFMALRIAVNDEFGALDALLAQIDRALRQMNGPEPTWLRPGARVGIISFHSLEDRMVKRAFAQLGREGLATVMTKKPVQADESEVEMNPRARSAKLRVLRAAHGDPNGNRQSAR